MEASRPSHEVAPVSFSDPPVIEVALSIQFASGITDDTRTLGQFWPLIRERYPRLEQQPALPSQTEDFGIPAGPQFQFLAEPPSPRYWFLSAGGARLVQVQPDRFIFNWRKTEEEQQYPRYRELRPEFESHLSLLLGLLSDEQRTAVMPTWSEVTYVNHVLPEAGQSTRPALSDILTLVNPPDPEAAVPDLEDAHLVERFVVREEGTGEPLGRLHVTATPAVRNTDQVPLYAITLVARLRVAEPTVEAALASLDRGRDLIVQAFRDLTRPTMHQRWALHD